MDEFNQGLMLGQVLELSKHTASKIDVIEARQAGLIERIDRLESDKSPLRSRPVNRVLLAAAAALSALFANLKAEDVGGMVAKLLRGMGSH
jgi:hypothetical protein